MFLYIYMCVCETLHDSCQTQLSASLSCKMEKFSHSSFKEKVTSRRFSRRCYGDRSSQDHVAPPLKEGAVVGMEVVASSIQDAAQRLTAIHSRLKTEHETLHDSCQTQLSASLFCKMAKFSHSSFKEKVTSRRFSRRCYGGRSSQDHVAPPLKGRCSGGDGGGCLEHPGCGPTSYSYSFSSKD